MIPRNTLVIVVFLIFVHHSCGRVERRCDSIDLRNRPHEAFKHEGSKSDWKIYKECTILDGDFTISMMASDDNTDDQFPVFQELREITGSVLVFSVHGLTTLRMMFPNLRIIGGQSLIMNYALVIYQNPDLRTIGLDKLTVIRNGGVRIKDNAKLCYAESINWDSILVGKLRDVIVENSGVTGNPQHIIGNVCKEYDGCQVEDPSKCQKIGDQLACWNATSCQRYCKYHKLPDDTVGPGCSPTGARCHPECIGGCEVPNNPASCYGCRNFEVDGVCQHKCPADRYELLDWRCVTKEECNARRPISPSTNTQDKMIWKAFQGKCHYDCPKGYEEDDKDNSTCKVCESYCPKKCAGGIIHSIGDALKYSKCNIIEGNLGITIKIGAESVPAEKFAEAFGEIEEIMGSLEIQMSHAFTNLYMFRSLRTIHGQDLVNNKYALVVEENPNLRQLFNIEQQPLEILNGTVNFQENKMLCVEKIDEFLRHIKIDPAEADISRYSNGEKAVCNEVPIEVTLVKVGPNTVHLKWSKFDTFNMDQRKFLGYQVFFKKVDYINQKVSIDDDRSACADSWDMQFVNTSVDVEKEGTIISVEPNTIYAYYVQTRLVNHPGARSGISPILYVETHFHYPGPPVIKKAVVLDAHRIALELGPPLEPKGNVTHYQISWSINEDSKQLTYQDPCTDIPHQIRQAQLAMEKEEREKKQGTCSSIKGCCKCKDVRNSKTEDNAFDEIIDEITHQQNDKEQISNFNVSLISKRKKRENMDELIDFRNFTTVDVTTLDIPAVNVTSLNVILAGLRHFSEYRIQILSCQDEKAVENWCSVNSAQRTLRTRALPDNDVVEPYSIKVGMVKSTNETTKRIDGRRISWAAPEDPNSFLIAFKVKVYKDDGDTPLEQCVRYNDYIANGKGVIFNGLTDGEYSFEVRSLTLNGLSKPTIVKELFDVYIPGWFTWDRILYIFLGVLVLVIAGWILGRKYYKRNFGKKVQEYLRQTISANPEYLSQVDVYKIDEWELKREDLILKEEIGRGTFGKVFKGYGKNITSVCGIKFGECAIKMVPESATHAERIHFLLEASVMKQFDTSFIVKLLGVVSDGQPVLVVMELMQNGNLRDFLRSRRPDAEENINNAPLPTMVSYFKWAIQIADGMAYLESLKFCHRDLAARNCMVTLDETVKIGDFGMARDIYYHEYYRPAGKRLMPVRWMAPESLKDGIFTVKSDVWSYGIVLYEMLTLGEQPYAGLGNDQVFNYIGLKRNILTRPHMCPVFWYDLMRVCWKYDSRERPWFYQIVLYMKNTIEKANLETLIPMFENQCFVTTHFDQIEDEEYDFSYNEEAEKAKKHHILRELEKLEAQNAAEYEYHKRGFNDNDSMKDMISRKDSIDSAKFNMLTIADMNDKLEPPEILTRKQIQEREKEKIKKKKDEDSHVSVAINARKPKGSRRMPPEAARSDLDRMKESKQVTERLKDDIKGNV